MWDRLYDVYEVVVIPSKIVVGCIWKGKEEEEEGAK